MMDFVDSRERRRRSTWKVVRGVPGTEGRTYRQTSWVKAQKPR